MRSLKYSLKLIFKNQKSLKWLVNECMRPLNNKGFTLVEVMFSTFISVIILGMVMILYVGANNNMTMGLALAEINSDGRLVTDRIVRNVRWGTQIVPSRTVSTTTYTTGNDELIIQIPSIKDDGDVLADKYDYVIYVLDPPLDPLDSTDTTTMRMIVDPDPDSESTRNSFNQIIAENINSFALSSGGIPLLELIGGLSGITSLEIVLIVDKQILLNQNATETIISEVELRNN